MTPAELKILRAESRKRLEAEREAMEKEHKEDYNRILGELEREQAKLEIEQQHYEKNIQDLNEFFDDE